MRVCRRNSVCIFPLCLTLSVFLAQADVLYNGPTSVLETQPFSVSCNCSQFANIKWRIIGADVHYIEKEDDKLIEGRKYSNISVVSALPIHSGNYKCSYEQDDYGHNVTVVVAIKISLDFNGRSCTSAKVPTQPLAPSSQNVNECVVAEPYAGNLTLECKTDTPLPSNSSLIWLKSTGATNSSIQQSDRIKIFTPDKSPSRLVLNFTSTVPEDAGRYQCQMISKDEPVTTATIQTQLFVDVKVLPYVKNAHKDVTAIEENGFNLTCIVLCSDKTTVSWNVSTSEGNKTYTGSEGRIVLSNVNDSMNAMLHVKSANITTDRGHYVCWAKSDLGESLTNTTIFVRIKSKYAALWPFLGICAEVIILCTIILIYEKKRDKSEMEESDTDQGPETKSSPEQGQDGVRYRK